MYRVKLKWNSTKEFDAIISKEEKRDAQHEYWKHMKGDYFFGALVEVIDGKEKNLASFCKSEFA